MSTAMVVELCHASGLHRRACSSVVHRWDDAWPLAIDHGQSYVCDFEGDDNFVSGPVDPFYTGLWRGASGGVHVAHFMGEMHSRPSIEASWSRTRLMDSLYGVWGLDESAVFAWGLRDGEPAMARYDGATWQPMPAPSRAINSMHACDEQTVMAVGRDGMIAHYDGGRWNELVSPISSTLSSVFVESPDEIYACGPSEHVLLEGSVYGFRRVLHHGLPLHGVVKYNDVVYLGAGHGGLLRLKGAGLVPTMPELAAVKFDERGVLLISARDRIAETHDGRDFEWWWKDGVECLISI